MLLVALSARSADSASEGYRSRSLTVPSGGRSGFSLLSASTTGITFTNRLSEARAAENQIRLNGSGVALGDVDGDGRCDIYLCAGENGNALYRNLGDWRFTDITASAGVACEGQYSTGATLVDVDGDVDLDLLVNGIGAGTQLFLNDGRGSFTRVVDSGLDRSLGATTSALADVDGDGDLDLFVANYRTTTIRSTGFSVLNVGGRRVIRPEDRDRLEYTPEGRVLEHGETPFLYLNDGKGKFRAMSWIDGTFLDEEGRPLTRAPHDWGLAAMFRDLNADGYPDLYVCNDFHSTDKIWINTGKGGFRLAPRRMFRHTSTFSMSVDFADVNRDGLDDLYVADMLGRDHSRRLMQVAAMEPQATVIGKFLDRPQYDHSTLQLNRGDGTYSDVAFYAGLEATDWNWSAAFLDVDLDGFEDLLAVCGQMFDPQDLDAEARIQAQGPWPQERIPMKLLMFPRLPQPKLAFRNQGDLTFRECGTEWGFDQVGVTQGLAMADLDGDGDLDVVVNGLNAGAGVYRNESSAPRISVRLKGEGLNTGGVGARIRVSGGGPVAVQTQERIAGGRYLSSDEGLRVFAAFSNDRPLRIDVDWPGGRRSVVAAARPNHEYEILEAASSRSTGAPSKQPASVSFEDVSGLLSHTHTEADYDDFQGQPLLPWRMSRMGPGVAWTDVDGDGTDELVIGGGRSGRLGVYHWSGASGFLRLSGGPVDEPFPVDQSGWVGWIGEGGKRWLLAGQMEWEGAGDGGVVGYDLVEGTRAVVVPGWKESVGPLAVGDLDGDGDLDLFVGGRVKGGRYSEACRSAVFRNDGGRLVEDESRTRGLGRPGRVSGAVMSDLDGDGLPELVLACEWGPVRVYRNAGGRLTEVTAEWGLEPWRGWWTGVTAGDFDGDGRMDIVASNWGLNTKYRASGKHPRRLYAVDVDEDGTVDLIEAYIDPKTGLEVPERDLNTLSRAIPQLAARFRTHREFGEATVGAILGDRAALAKVESVTTLASTVFLNRGGTCEARPLPPEAQFAPAFGTVVADYDGDGREDMFLSQNFFAYQPQGTRSDAGQGLWLRGDGRGGFRAVPAAESGVAIDGEQRGAAVADYDGDGRVDLVVAQNGSATKLYRNSLGKPGLRVRLIGPPGNPNGIGAVLRLGTVGAPGPAREVHGGSGYWSQDSSISVLARTPNADRLTIRWPGGRVTTTEVPAGATEISVSVSGETAVRR
ncbi:MAG: CRTAC1 family protein [Limisphaerales bacterium]